MKDLQEAIGHLRKWQARERKAGRTLDHRCLEAVRYVLSIEGLALPIGDGVDYKGRLAISNFRALRANPTKWGWEQIHSPLFGVCLVYFGNCGKLSDGRIAGHIAILDVVGKKHYSNNNYFMNKNWAGKIVGAFRPLDDA